MGILKILLLCFWVLNGLNIAIYTTTFIFGFEMDWGKLGNAYGGMMLWGYLLHKLEARLKDEEDSE